jgi:hypothetical protein
MLADGWFDFSLSWQTVLIGAGLFLVTFFASIFFVGFLLVKLPHDYFVETRCRTLWVDRHPVLRWTGIILKNVSGLILLTVGVIMLFTPGQGVLTILIGLMLVDFPGKRKLERALVGRPKVLSAINALRSRYGKPPLVMEDPTCPPIDARQET